LLHAELNGFPNYSLESAENIAEPGNISRNELIRSTRSDSRIEVDDFIERGVLVEVEIVNVSSETSSEGEGEFGLEETEH